MKSASTPNELDAGAGGATVGSGRLVAVLASAAMAAGLTLFGANWVAAALGTAIVLAWALLWPRSTASSERPTAAHRGPADGAESIGSELSAVEAPAGPPPMAPDVWQAIADGIDTPALLLDDEGKIIVSNRLAATALSLRAGNNLALSIRSPELARAMAGAIQAREPQKFGLEIFAPVEHHFDGLATPLPAQPASAPSLLLVLRDRTEQQQLAQIRSEFVANASHELRTPLASIRGFVETLQGPAKNDPAARERFLGIMQSETARMSRLIEDLLSLNRIEMREHVPPTGRVDLATVAAEVVSALAPVAAERRITLELPQASTPAWVTGDRDELVQVAQNLIQNAVKYGRQGGRVTLGLRPEQGPQGRTIAFIVKDDGIGIAPEHLPRLTERFYRVSAQASRERGGTGLGLAIVKHIVNRHRGALSIQSRPGEGTEVTVRLPAAIPAA